MMKLGLTQERTQDSYRTWSVRLCGVRASCIDAVMCCCSVTTLSCESNL